MNPVYRKLLSDLFSSAVFLSLMVVTLYFLQLLSSGPEGLAFLFYGIFLLPISLIFFVLSFIYLLQAISEYDKLFSKNISKEKVSFLKRFFNILISIIILCMFFFFAVFGVGSGQAVFLDSDSVKKERTIISNDYHGFYDSGSGETLLITNAILRISDLATQSSVNMSSSYENSRDFGSDIRIISGNAVRGTSVLKIENLYSKLSSESKNELLQLKDISLSKDNFFSRTWFLNYACNVIEPECYPGDDVKSVIDREYKKFLGTKNGAIFLSILRDSNLISEITELNKIPKEESIRVEKSKEDGLKLIHERLIKVVLIPICIIFFISTLLILKFRKISFNPLNLDTLLFYLIVLVMLFLLTKLIQPHTEYWL